MSIQSNSKRRKRTSRRKRGLRGTAAQHALRAESAAARALYQATVAEDSLKRHNCTVAFDDLLKLHESIVEAETNEKGTAQASFFRSGDMKEAKARQQQIENAFRQRCLRE